ncbi:glycosyltransferase [Chryseobacterium echinoideorum]|uniref:glycosyltransferase n=1 Tax=Chryseobacterium echinoideorum TaxID=1549648 RepID=UPI001187005F|nr:glycosyltransferase [Chryseobacterium echinoideorum]
MIRKKILVAIPCYNEELRLPINDYISFISKNEYTFCFINDGSSDRTIDVLNGIKIMYPDKVLVVDNHANSGKSNALYHGYQSVKNLDFTHFAFLDADLATPLDELSRLSEYLSEDIQFVFGSRVNRVGSNIKRKLSRHLIGRFFATINSLLLDIPVYDTQCGAKLFSRQFSDVAFSEIFDTNWVFDIEVFFRILNFKKNTDINIYAREIPLEKWTDIGDTSIKPKHYIGIFLDLFKIYKKYR